MKLDLKHFEIFVFSSLLPSLLLRKMREEKLRFLPFGTCVVFTFLIVGRFHQWSLYFRMFGKGLQLKTTSLLVFFLWLVKSEKLVNNRIVDHIEKCCLFSDFSMVLGLLDQLQIFSELYLIELLGLLTGLGYSSCGT